MNCKLSRLRRKRQHLNLKKRPLIFGHAQLLQLASTRYVGRPSRYESLEPFAEDIQFSWLTGLNYLPSQPLAHGGWVLVVIL